ncbi:MAG: alpha-L-fucosidase, partial [Clostridia bacterium]|nr:alpha-L-fucosidase [Clostridia bacterium]
NIEPYGPVPSERQLRHINKFKKKAFFHVGVNTFTDLEWGEGGESEQIFAPSALDTRQWIKAAAQAGFQLAIITAKHHDGFCLWDSAYTEHCVRNSPYKGDVVREFANACREFGLGVGVYISPWDRNAPFWGTDKYSEYYALQLTELMTKYGHIDEVWWDGAGSAETPYDWKRWNDIIRENQPDACIFGSMGATDFVDLRWVGNESGYAGKTHYSTIDPEYLLHETPRELNRGAIITPEELASGVCPKRYIPAEVDVSIRPGWFYHAHQDGEVKSPSRLAQIWFDSIGSNAFMLLNFPPDRRGIVMDTDAENARLADEIIKKTFAVNLAYGAAATADSVYCAGCEAENLLQPYDGCFYAANDKKAIVEFELPHSVTFDCYSLSEVIELGERVIGHKVEYLNGDCEWETLAEGTSVGVMKAQHFEPVTASRIRLTVEGYAYPVLRSFGLYKLPDGAFAPDPVPKNAEDILSKKGERVEISEDGKTLFAEFGGVYPFNTLKMTCENVFYLDIF